MQKDRIPWCQHCKTKENLHINSRNRHGRISYMCRKCTTNNQRKYRKTAKGREATRKAVYKSTKKHQDRQDARLRLNYHVKMGRIIRPKKCPSCNKNKKVEGHHEDYSKPLEVKWLCRQCHADVHMQSVAK